MTGPELSDAQRRLLAAVAERLPDGQVRELYLFAPMRQGGVETGLAVIAAAEATESAEAASAPEPQGAEAETVAEVAEAGSVTEAAVQEPGPETGEAQPDADAADAHVAGDVADVEVVADESQPDAEAADSRATPEPVEATAPIDVPACAPEDAEVMRAAVLAAEAAVEADEPITDAAAEAATSDAPACDPTDAAAGSAPEDASAEATAEADEAIAEQAIAELEQADDAPHLEEPAAPAPPARYTVYTARYRLQLKGPDRGKWAMELVAEADAPLLTVDAVVRGVQRRAGDVAEVERLTGPELARLLGGRS